MCHHNRTTAHSPQITFENNVVHKMNSSLSSLCEGINLLDFTHGVRMKKVSHVFLSLTFSQVFPLIISLIDIFCTAILFGNMRRLEFVLLFLNHITLLYNGKNSLTAIEEFFEENLFTRNFTG